MNRGFLLSIIIAIILLSISNICLSQNEIGNPFITNYFAKDYKGHAQNWSITQDERGIMYIGNGDGILVFDGQNWEDNVERIRD